MNQKRRTASGKPYDIHERLLIFACDIVKAVQLVHTRGPVARAFSYQLLSAGTSTGANAEESDGASSHNDFIAKNRIALKEAKETRFRLRVCQRGDFLDTSTQAFDPVYMTKLYDLGFSMAQAGYPWKKTPPRMAGH